MTGRHHQHRKAPAAPPAITSAALPATLLLRFQGHRLAPYRRPTSVAAPSPAARIPHAAATMSTRAGSISSSTRIDVG